MRIPRKRSFIACGFGLIHGLAFAAMLSNFQLSADKLALSILGFNLGIEMMQLFVIDYCSSADFSEQVAGL